MTRVPTRRWTTLAKARIEATDVPRDHLTVVVFGPGHGEGILVGLPDGRMGIVDGSSESDAPMEPLLRDLGIRRLAFACLTHPHQDHYGGLGRTMEAFGPAEVALFPSITGRSVKAELAAERMKSRRLPTSGTRDALERAIAQSHRAKVQPSLVARVPYTIGEVEIVVLAPTERARASESREVARGEARGDPNEVSGALMLRWDQAGVLLAGDLVNATDPDWGWSDARGLVERCQVAKVSHHASHNGHDDAVWAKIAPELAIVTPFKDGQESNPPRRSDAKRLLDLGVELVITSPPRWWRPGRGLVKVPSGRPASRANKDCAVAVQLDRTGRIVNVVLGGRAAFYRRA